MVFDSLIYFMFFKQFHFDFLDYGLDNPKA